MADPITTTGTAGTLQYSGLTSDTKWADVVDDLVNIERIHINRQQAWKDEWVNKTTVIEQLESQLLVLESKAGDLNSYREFRATASSSSDETVLTVTSNSFAETGAHTVDVGSDVSHILASQGVSSTTSAIGNIGEQDFVIQVGANSITVEYVSPALGNGEIDSNSTLQDIVDAINNDAENTDYVTASIKEDGNGTNVYRMTLTANGGGDDNLISVTSNPLNLNFNSNNISNTVETTWTGATATTSGTSTAATDKTYTFTAAGTGTVGQSGSLTINWDDGTGNTGSIEVGSSYTAGSSLTIADGLSLSFASGNITSGQEIKVNVYNNIEDVVQADWQSTFPTPQKAGNYTGNTNKIFNFAILDNGNIGTDEIELYWSDSEGNSDTIIIPSTYTSGDEIDIYQGVSVTFDTSMYQSVNKNGKFSIHVTHPTLQSGQDTGLAQFEIETHKGFADADRTYVSETQGTFSYTYAGTTRTLTVPSGITLTGLSAIINSDDSNPGVVATIVNDGTGLSTAYHLQLIGTDTGADYKIENISHTLDTLSGDSSDDYGFSETQAAQNSMLKFDGYPADSNEYIQRNSNTVGDIISGVTLNLINSGSSTITINTDNGTVKQNILEFVNTINSVLDYVTAMTTHIEVGSDKYEGPMQGNYTFQFIEQKINSILSSSVPGLTDGTDTYTILSQIGITTTDDQIKIEDSEEREWTKSKRRWTIDDSVLDEALSNDFDAVANLFINNTDTGVSGIAELVGIEAETTTEVYSAVDPGMLEVLKHNYEGIIDNIDVKIEREERRIAMVEDRLNKKFAMLETMLGQLGGQEKTLIAILDAGKES